MPYGLGFSQSDINARCRRQFDKRDSTQGKRPKKSLKLAGLKVLKQKSALNELRHHLEKESEQNRNDKDIECRLPQRQETVVSVNLLGTETKIFGGERIYFAWS